MTSTVYIVKDEDAGDDPHDVEHAAFKMPVKSVFGRMLCDTDGSIGYPTRFGPDEAFNILAECEKLRDRLAPAEIADLAKVRKWAEEGHDLFADWIH